ncbi:uncharacterized protein C1orf21 homolog isoform X1 [Alligator mississippiensis]|uniref:uncharacterized protein C1orf21 homolog isoform X1 n=1 Tax=Alligator mississippiensis TaxID=8496 RepID=UPI0028777092|nr:uncharacterized protein C1orf21 homolog isoform X1 [Alligator mississippiensis]XP_059584372.1 uncharacterized protein C1orf21 homolog isoform X1 [Alligator mississippiensis]XP_059584373.1 uncharacterized protein C1orf21 homolog isoform X1 [Alligator mississippiensis]
MGCASAKHVSTVQNEEEAQKGKNYQNGDVFGDEYRIKPVEEVKYMKNGEDDQKIAARNQENLEKSASSNVRLKSNKEIPGLVHQPRAKRSAASLLSQDGLPAPVPPFLHTACTSLKANRSSSECWMRKLKRVVITVQKRRMSHSASSANQNRNTAV